MICEGAGAGAGVEVEAGAEVEALEGPRALVLRVPGKVIVGLSRFQQFFLMYAKLMAGLRDSKVRESDTTHLVMHKAVMSAGKTKSRGVVLGHLRDLTRNKRAHVHIHLRHQPIH